MTMLTLWTSAKYVTVAEASLLLVHILPEELNPEAIKDRYGAILTAERQLLSAIRDKELDAEYIKYSPKNTVDFLENYVNKITEIYKFELSDFKLIMERKIDTNKIRLRIDDVCEWVENKNLNSNYFWDMKRQREINKIRDAKRRNIYSKKLDAANKAYKHFSRLVTENPNYVFKASPKKNVIDWLEENSERLGLTREVNGQIIPNDLGIEEIAKVVNWDTVGGAKKILKSHKDK